MLSSYLGVFFLFFFAKLPFGDAKARRLACNLALSGKFRKSQLTHFRKSQGGEGENPDSRVRML